MLNIRLLNSGAVLNNFKEISTIPYVPGEVVKIVIRMYDAQLDLRRIPAAGATYKIVFQKKDGTELEKIPTELSAEDRSILTTTLDATESADIVGANFRVEVTEGTDLIMGVAQNALARTLISGDC